MPKPRTLHDEYFRRAKREGYVARSAYKLTEINDRRRIIRKGSRVLDLGCSPGSWLQVIDRTVGLKGAVVGIDLKPIDTLELTAPHHTLTGDITTTAPSDYLDILRELTDSSDESVRFDAVLSDMAPNTTGGGKGLADHFGSVELCEHVLDIAQHVLRPSGHLAMKVFEGEAYPDLLKRTAKHFKLAKGFKPRACRDASREIYIVATGYKPSTPADPKDEHAHKPGIPPEPVAGWGSKSSGANNRSGGEGGKGG